MILWLGYSVRKSATNYWAFFFFLSMSSSPCYVTEILTSYSKTCLITTQPTHFFNKNSSHKKHFVMLYAINKPGIVASLFTGCQLVQFLPM
jgi:hypothetical protein